MPSMHLKTQTIGTIDVATVKEKYEVIELELRGWLSELKKEKQFFGSLQKLKSKHPNSVSALMRS